MLTFSETISATYFVSVILTTCSSIKTTSERLANKNYELRKEHLECSTKKVISKPDYSHFIHILSFISFSKLARGLTVSSAGVAAVVAAAVVVVAAAAAKLIENVYVDFFLYLSIASWLLLELEQILFQ